MTKNLFLLGLTILLTFQLQAQEKILVVQSPYVVMLNADTGAVEDAQFIDMTAQNPITPKAVRQVGDEIWVSDQVVDAIFRYDMEGNYLSSITGNMDNIKGFDVINNQEVWVTNAGTSGGAGGSAIVRFDTAGNYVGNIPTPGNDSFDILDNGNGEVYISFIDDNTIQRWSYNGTFIDNLVETGTLNFPQQVWQMDSGDLLVGNFITPSGIFVFDSETGEQLNFWSKPDVRGVIETGDGNVLYSSSNGIYKMDVTTGNSTLIQAGNAHYFTKINDEDETGGCTTPTLSIDEISPVCEGNVVTIEATSNADQINWYDSETSTIPIFTGSEFTTPELSETTSYWVQAVSFGIADGDIIDGGARVAPSTNSSSNVVDVTSPWGLSFDVTEDFTINHVDVYLASSTPGNIEMQLLNENWEVIDETTVAAPAGNSTNPIQFEVPLDFHVQAGNTYRLVATSSPIMVREFASSHSGFPFPIGNVGSVTGGTINSSDTNNTVYYFFYNWTVTVGIPEVCETERMEVEVTVNPIPDAPDGEADQFFTMGDTLDDLEVDATGDLIWYSDENGSTVLPSDTELVDGTTYYVSQTVNGCESELLAITVHIELGVNDSNNALFSIYPNPVKDFINISGKQTMQSAEIYDMNGKLISKLQSLGLQNKIDFRNYPSGTYILKLKIQDKIHTVKIVKQ